MGEVSAGIQIHYFCGETGPGLVSTQYKSKTSVERLGRNINTSL